MTKKHQFPSPDKQWAYFSKLTIENVRCFGPAQTLDLCSPEQPDTPAQWTIILGENGTGKTTLLQALVLMSPVSSFNTSVKEHELVSRFSDIRQGIHQWWTTRGVERVQHPYDCKLLIDVLSKKDHSIHINLDASFGGGGMAHSVNWHNDHPLPLNFAYGSSRRISPISLDGQRQDSEGFETLFSDEDELIDPAQTLIQTYLIAQLNEDEAAKQRAHAKLAQLKEAFISALPDVQDVQIKLLEGKPAVLFTTSYGQVQSGQLSSGYRAMAAWIGDLVGRMFEAYPDSEDPLSEPAVVLIDEFDLHMHPTWQRESIAFLTARFPAVQFIVTAHSPLVVQAAPDANLVLLRKVDDHVEINNEPVNVKNWRIDQILTSELFGLKSARSASTQAILEERRALLTKPSLTDEEKARARELEALMEEIPASESAQEIKASQLLEQLVTQLQAKGLKP